MQNKPPLKIQTTTLWEYPSQHYGNKMQGDQAYAGATPSHVIWNLLQRYTREKDLVVDPMCGSGTTLDVARDLNRRALGYDIAPFREDIFRADARKLPLEDEKADFVFIDPPYSTHLEYSDDPACIGKLDAATGEYYEAMREVIRETYRVLRPRRYMGLYVSDSWHKNQPFQPIGFRLFAMLEQYFEPADIVCVVRHNRTMKRPRWHSEAVAGNYFLRGFNYLFIMKKGERKPPKRDQLIPKAKRATKPKGWARAKPKDRPKDKRRKTRPTRPR